MSERDYTLRFGETNRVGIGTLVVFVVAPPAVVTVLAGRAVPNGMGGVELSAEAAAVWKGKGSSRTTSRHFFIVILGHGEPPEAVVTGVFYCCG